ncbi:ribosome small subunit-dependent GTPase A [Mesobacillus zeae]|uniref:Small ribosomal subunit biogenesis GTPase RsgA n=1 Tax=Mesobacillus zeae TaxID=1917180 RepID=A0A398B0L9_9BACI|nr:ribosome small subunit-dependent GTPase A [Mesobacillus zeae]RID83355.1 ribosome small subunit-dependent GTPase A [Mesobacillus zeae]
MINFTNLGLNEELLNEYSIYKDNGFELGRICSEHKGIYKILTEVGEVLGNISGNFLNSITQKSDFPAVGDWVVISLRKEEKKATIHSLLTRFSKFSRKSAGKTIEEQVVATNINTVFLTISLNNDFNLRRIERYLISAWESGAKPVVVLNKCDLVSEEIVENKIKEVESIAIGVPIYPVSCLSGYGMDSLKKHCTSGETVALLGSSGAGKSTICNYLLGKRHQITQQVREKDDKGKHTTTHRELLQLPTGGNLIDTPGMRELQLWDIENSLSIGFSDIEKLAEKCLFKDCKHIHEPSCAVKEAIKDGLLDQARLDSYFKVEKEIRYLERKGDKLKNSLNKKKIKKIGGDRTRFNR